MATIIVLAMIASIFPVIAEDTITIPELSFCDGESPFQLDMSDNVCPSCDCHAPTCCLPKWCNPKKINFDSVNIGNQNAFTAGIDWYGPFDDIPAATNAFAIDKIQEACPCDCSLYNIEMITAGDQFASAIGQGVSTNTVMISTRQK